MVRIKIQECKLKIHMCNKDHVKEKRTKIHKIISQISGTATISRDYIFYIVK